MKKYTLLALVMVLTATLLMGCGCRNSNISPTTATMPTILPTETIAPATQAPTQATTMPPEKETAPMETIDRGNGPLETNATAAPDGKTDTESSPSGRTGTGNIGPTSPTEGSRRMPKS